MMALAPHLKIYVHLPPTDLRKSFDGLTGLVRSAFEADPRDSGWFLFLVSGARAKAGGRGKRDPVHPNAPEGLFWYHLGCISPVPFQVPNHVR